jgi:hypothetical protein
MGAVRRWFVTLAVVGVAASGLIGIASAPAGADTTVGYTIELQVPQGLSGEFLPCRLATVDLTTGVVTGIGSFLPPEDLACANDLAFSPSGVLYGISQFLPADEEPVEPGGFGATQTEPEVHLVRFDLTTGAVTDLGAIGARPAFIGDLEQPGGGITFDAAGNLWVLMVGVDDECDNDAFCLYQVDPTNPANVTFKGLGPAETFLYGLTANCALNLYTSEQVQPESDSQSDVAVALGGNVLMSVNTGAGTFSQVGTGFGGNHMLQSMDYSADGVLHAIGSQFASEHKGFLSTGFLYTVNAVAGTATQGAKLSAPQFRIAQALAVSPLGCPDPIAPPTPPVDLQPNFTG